MPLFAAAAVVGALMPVLPRATIPLIFQQHHYVDRITSISGAVAWWPLCAWSSLPFVFLALVWWRWSIWLDSLFSRSYPTYAAYRARVRHRFVPLIW